MRYGGILTSHTSTSRDWASRSSRSLSSTRRARLAPSRLGPSAQPSSRLPPAAAAPPPEAPPEDGALRFSDIARWLVCARVCVAVVRAGGGQAASSCLMTDDY